MVEDVKQPLPHEIGKGKKRLAPHERLGLHIIRPPHERLPRVRKQKEKWLKSKLSQRGRRRRG